MAETRYFQTYLGDGAYVYLDNFRGVVLYTSNGISEINRVVLEPEVLQVFERWLASMKQELSCREGGQDAAKR